MDGSSPETKRLRRNVEWALQRALDPSAVLPMLHRLSRAAPEGTRESVYAERLLAELLVDAHPWRAALHARRVLAVDPKTDDGAWAILALSYALLGHHRAAVRAYRHAIEIAPRHPAYKHNLGHLLDVALGRPAEALLSLGQAYHESDGADDVAVSYAHALGRAGYLAEAKRVSRRALVGGGETAHLREHAALAEWLEKGAPEEASLLPRRPPSRAPGLVWRGPVARAGRAEQAKRKRRRKARGGDEDRKLELLDATLLRGLTRLPLDVDQRVRARLLAQQAWMVGVPDIEGAPRGVIPAVAAAIAYAVASTDRVPLTQADVAACFRVSVPALRGCFKELRAYLDVGDGGTAARTR